MNKDCLISRKKQSKNYRKTVSFEKQEKENTHLMLSIDLDV